MNLQLSYDVVPKPGCEDCGGIGICVHASAYTTGHSVYVYPTVCPCVQIVVVKSELSNQVNPLPGS